MSRRSLVRSLDATLCKVRAYIYQHSAAVTGPPRSRPLDEAETAHEELIRDFVELHFPPKGAFSFLGSTDPTDAFSQKHRLHEDDNDREERPAAARNRLPDYQTDGEAGFLDEDSSSAERCLGPNVTRFWLARGFSLANVLIAERFDGLMLIDTTENNEAILSVLAAFNRLVEGFCQEATIKPIRMVFLSHSHHDHIGGIGALLSYNRNFVKGEASKVPTKIVAHHETYEAMTAFYLDHAASHMRRANKQFGVNRSFNDTTPLPYTKTVLSAGIGRELVLANINDTEEANHAAFPNYKWYGDELMLPFGDFDLHLIKMPGETDDQICFFIPHAGIFHIADNFYFAFPSIYPLRGGKLRSPEVWIKSLDKFLREFSTKTKVLAVGHTSPIRGTSYIRRTVVRYRDALEFINDQALRLMGLPKNADEIANMVTDLFVEHFPSMDAEDNLILGDPTLPFYEKIEWGVKAIVTNKRGWFFEDALDINSQELSSRKRDERIFRLIESCSTHTCVVGAILDALSSGECQWALILCSILESGTVQRAEEETRSSNQCKSSMSSYSAGNVPQLFSDNDAAVTEPEAHSCELERPAVGEIYRCEDSERLAMLASSSAAAKFAVARCLKRRALSCLAQAEVSSMGRNWYIYEQLTDEQKYQSRLQTLATEKTFKKEYLENVPDLTDTVRSLSVRFDPAYHRWFKGSIAFMLKFEDKNEIMARDNDFPELVDIVSASHKNQTYSVIVRNSAVSVTLEDPDILKKASHNNVREYLMVDRLIEVTLTWRDFRNLLLKHNVVEHYMSTDTSYGTDSSIRLTGRVESFAEWIKFLLTLDS